MLSTIFHKKSGQILPGSTTTAFLILAGLLGIMCRHLHAEEETTKNQATGADKTREEDREA